MELNAKQLLKEKGIIDVDQLLKGKATIIKGKNYYETKAYVEPFLERMSKFTNDFRVQVALPDQITRTTNNEISLEDITFNRVWIQAVLPSNCYENHDEVVGMVYGLDVRKPIVKLYRGGLNKACTNLCVFSPSFLDIQEIKPEEAIDFSPVEKIMEQDLNIRKLLDKLHSTSIQYDDSVINELLGKWIRNAIEYSYDNNYGKVKVSTSSVIKTYKSLYEDTDSPYYVKYNTPTDMYNVYQAFTQQITDDEKDIMNKAEKTFLLREIIEI